MTPAQDNAAISPLPPERVVLITGADRNLGKAMSLACLRAGARVVLTAMYGSHLQAVVEESKAADRALTIEGDLALERDRKEILRQAFDRFGRIDVLVNNAAVTPETYWPNWLVEGEPRQWTLSVEFYRSFLEIDSVAPHDFMAAVLPRMLERGWGRIINVSTSLGTMLRFWPYGSAKAALEAQTAVLAAQLEGSGVTANVLAPGGFVKPAPLRMPNGEIIRPDYGPAIMEAPIQWLASDDSNRVNGKRIIAARWNPSVEAAALEGDAIRPIGWSGQE